MEKYKTFLTEREIREAWGWAEMCVCVEKGRICGDSQLLRLFTLEQQVSFGDHTLHAPNRWVTNTLS